MARQHAVWSAFTLAIRDRRWRSVAFAILLVTLVAQPARFSDERGVAVSDREAPSPATAGNPPDPHAPPGMREQSDVDAVAATAARKYRVAEHVVRDFVTAAFAEARRNRLDPLLVVAVIGVESRFNPIARSDFGATGLMQIIPRFHRDKFSPAKGETVLDPRINIRVGTRVLREYVNLGGTESAGLQLYNGSAHDPERGYARKVFAERARLRAAVGRIRARFPRSDA